MHIMHPPYFYISGTLMPSKPNIVFGNISLASFKNNERSLYLEE